MSTKSFRRKARAALAVATPGASDEILSVGGAIAEIPAFLQVREDSFLVGDFQGDVFDPGNFHGFSSALDSMQ